ncbi:unnamed protein product [Brassica rapa subsp. trilocularis]
MLEDGVSCCHVLSCICLGLSGIFPVRLVFSSECRGVCGAVKLFVGLVFFLRCGVWCSTCGFRGWRRRRFASLWSLVAACWCLASSGSSQFVCGSGMGSHPSNQNGGSGCGLLRPSLFSNNLFNMVFVSRERVSAQVWVYTVPVECKRGGNLWRKLLNDGIVVSRLLLVPPVVSIFWPFYGFVFRFSARVRYGFSLEAVGTVAFRV